VCQDGTPDKAFHGQPEKTANFEKAFSGPLSLLHQTEISRRLAAPGSVRSDLPASMVYSSALTVLT
jgi:hypothetical protein